MSISRMVSPYGFSMASVTGGVEKPLPQSPPGTTPEHKRTLEGKNKNERKEDTPPTRRNPATQGRRICILYIYIY